MPSYIREAFPADDRSIIVVDEHGSIDPAIAPRVGFYVRAYYAGRREGALIAQMPNLEVVQTLTAGVDDVVDHVPANVLLCNAAGVHDASTAELTVGLMIASQRGFADHHDRQRAGQWQHEFHPSLADRRVLVIGAGRIANAITRRLLPFEVHVDRIGRTARTDELGAIHDMASLPTLLPQAEIVSIIVPLTPETTHLVDAEFLAQMQDGALLVNTARGRIVDTDALLVELRNGRLRAALDVTDPEPLPEGHALWSAPNTIITPHIGGDTSAFLPRGRRLVVDQVARWRAGERLANIVSR